jgi:hypothetical protein
MEVVMEQGRCQPPAGQCDALPRAGRLGPPLGLQLVELATTFIALELGVTTLAAAAAGRLASTGLARLRGAGGLLLALMALLLAASAVGLHRG